MPISINNSPNILQALLATGATSQVLKKQQAEIVNIEVDRTAQEKVIYKGYQINVEKELMFLGRVYQHAKDMGKTDLAFTGRDLCKMCDVPEKSRFLDQIEEFLDRMTRSTISLKTSHGDLNTKKIQTMIYDYEEVHSKAAPFKSKSYTFSIPKLFIMDEFYIYRSYIKSTFLNSLSQYAKKIFMYLETHRNQPQHKNGKLSLTMGDFKQAFYSPSMQQKKLNSNINDGLLELKMKGYFNVFEQDDTRGDLKTFVIKLNKDNKWDLKIIKKPDLAGYKYDLKLEKEMAEAGL